MNLLAYELSSLIIACVIGSLALCCDSIFNAGIALPLSILSGLMSFILGLVNTFRRRPRQRVKRAGLLFFEFAVTCVFLAFFFGVIMF